MRHAVISVFLTSLLAQGGAGQPPSSPLTVLRIASGPHGDVRNGDFVLDEERTQFDPAKDKQVVVFFQWLRR